MNIPVTAVVRTSDTVVTITLPALPTYDITSQEKITVTVPAVAVDGGVDIVADGAGRTNLLLRSEEFDNSGVWNVYDASVTANAVVDPNGTTTADSLLETVVNSYHLIAQYFTFPANTKLTYSIYLKSNGRQYVTIALRDSGSGNGHWDGAFVNFDLTNGVTTYGPSGGWIDQSASIESVGNGWYRCILTATCYAHTPDITDGRVDIFLREDDSSDWAPFYVGDVTKGVYAWGAQVEECETSTNYIPTTSTAVTVQDSSATALWKGDRTIERIIQGGAQDEETWASPILREKMILGQLMQLKTWNTSMYATNFRWVGTLSQTQSWGSIICVDYKWLGALAQTKTWGSAYWKAHDMLHQGAINQAKTWASAKNREHLVVGNLTLEKWLRQFPPFGEVWDKDSETATGWTKQSGVSGIWTKQSPTTESWNKRGKAS